MVAGVPTVLGRTREQAVLDGLLAGLRRGQNAALVIRGEAGIGKSALLEYCATQAVPAAVDARHSRFSDPVAAVEGVRLGRRAHAMAAPDRRVLTC